MSHSTSFTIEGVEYAIIHNGDWSGEATIVELRKPVSHEELLRASAGPDRGRVVQREVVLPGRLLQAIGRLATLQGLINVVERLMDVPVDKDLETALRREPR
jgi:hypothetical protein